MATVKNLDRDKVLRLLDAADDLAGKYAAVLAELRALVDGDEGIGTKLRRSRAFWCDTWQERHREPFDFDYKADSAWLKSKILAHGCDVVEAKMYSFIMGHDPSAERARHPFGWFRKGYNTYRGLPVNGDESAAILQRQREMRGQA